ncbi:MAG: hypothetical protein AAGL98_01635, partial [Planctomycetota bacterium]
IAATATSVGTDSQPIDYGPMQIVGRLGDPRVTESSGLALSHANSADAPHFWTHNDSGDMPRLFLMTGNGVVKHELPIDVPRAIDWEDMASFAVDGRPYLLIGDVGDNGHARAQVTLWLVPDPVIAGDAPPRLAPVAPVRKIDFTYADGPQDCESIAFDPTTNTVVIVTKILPQRTATIDTAGVYLLPLPLLPPPADTSEQAFVLERVADLPLRITVGMDLSPDGRRAVVGTYGDAWEFVRRDDQSWAEAFALPPRQIPLGPRGQSETIGYGPDGQTLYFTAEGEKKPVWKVAPRP